MAQLLTLPARTNRIPDPQMRNAAGSSSWTGTNLTAARVADPYWIGTGSMKLTVTGVAQDPIYGTTPSSGSAYRALVTAGEVVSAGIRARAAAGTTNRAARMELLWFNSSGTQVGGGVVGAWQLVPDNGTWATYKIEGQTVPATATYCRVEVMFSRLANQGGLTNSAAAISDVFYASGGDLTPGDTYDGMYLDGNQPDATWAGTAHASTSTRSAINRVVVAPGRSGVIKISPWMDIRDRNNIPVSDAKQKIISGRVEFDTERAVPMTFKGVTNDPDFFDPYKQFIAPHLDMTWEDGRSASYQIGLFQIQPFSKTETNLVELGDLVGMDVCALLAVRSYGGTKTVAVGTNIIQQVKDIIADQGFTRVNIASSSSVVTSKPMQWDPGTNKLKICNDLLVRAGYYPLWADRLGVLTSRPLDDLDNVEPNRRYVGGRGSAVVEPFVTDPQVDGLYNHIIVLKTQKGAAAIKERAKNTNPASGYSINNIGERVLVIKDSDIADSAAALRLAKKRLFDAGNIRVNSKMRTLIEPWHNGNEIYELHLANVNGKRIREADGIFLCKGWTIGFSATDSVMEHKLYRILRYQSEV